MHSFKRQIYKFGLIEDNEKNPPTVDDFSVEYQDGVFTFDASHFTNNFQDEDGDSYELIRVTSLPSVGLLKYEGNLIEAGFIFNSANANLLTFELPDSYMATSTGYCVFEDTIDNIIANEAADGFNLTYYGEGRLEFEKIVTSSIPNDTNIYAFFDATSMKIEDAQAAQAALIEWHTNYKQANELYTGDLYILPIVKEDWLDFPNIIWRGSSNRVRNNSDRPNDDFMALAILPPNFDTTSNNDNPSWTSPTELVTLAFIDEVSDGIEAYHRNRNGYGFNGQPTTQYFTDYKNFKFNYDNNFTFFKGIFYPIADIDAGNFNNIYNACVLQGFGAIEGGATYTLAEIENLGVTFAEERRFHWHLDPTHPYYTGTSLTVANPYSAEANTPVPDTNYNLQGLKDLGWAGVYDKDQPASEVFTSDSFSSDLNKYLEGSTIQTIERKTIYGDCTAVENICFNFKTSDDSEYLLFSNEAEFCFTGANDPIKVQEKNAPTVDSVERIYNKGTYQFTVTDFTTNFTDLDGDSYLKFNILNNFETSKGVTIGNIKKNSNNLTYPNIDDVINAPSYSYLISNYTYIIDNRLIKFNNNISNLTNPLEIDGYTLLENKGSELIFNKLDVTDPQNPSLLIQSIKGNDLGNNIIRTSFKTSDDSTYNLYSGINYLSLIMSNDNTRPTVDGGSVTINSTVNTFIVNNFTTNFNDNEGDSSKNIKIVSNNAKELGELYYSNYNINSPFSFSKNDIANLKFILNEDIAIYDGEAYKFEDSISNIVTDKEAQGYTLFSNIKGVLIFKNEQNQEIKSEGIFLENTDFNITFATSDDNEVELYSNVETLTLTVLGDINIANPENQPPTIGDVALTKDSKVRIITLDDILNNADPEYFDKENDELDAIRITYINPDNTGIFYLNNNPIALGLVITKDDLIQGNLTHVSDDELALKRDTFLFQVRDAVSMTWN